MNKNICSLYIMAKSNHFRKSRKQSQRGGAGAADHVIGVVGGIGQQVALPGSNVIAMKDLSAPPLVETKGGALVALTPATIETPVAPVKGGVVLPLTPAPLNGGGVLQDVAVPAVLLTANSLFKGRKTASKRLFKRRSSSRRRRSNKRRR
jgi:hypothetical protein